MHVSAKALHFSAFKKIIDFLLAKVHNNADHTFLYLYACI